MNTSFTKNIGVLKDAIKNVSNVGNDTGAGKCGGGTKVCYFDHETQSTNLFKFDSVILHGPDSFTEPDDTVSEMIIDNQFYTIGRPDGGKFQTHKTSSGIERLTDPHVRALLTQHGLSQVGMGGLDVFVNQSLPTSFWYSNGKPNSDLIIKSMDAARYPCEIKDKEIANIRKIAYGKSDKKTIFGTPQPEIMGAFWSIFFDTSLNPIKELSQYHSAWVMDIGGSTTDFTLVKISKPKAGKKKGKPIVDTNHSFSIPFGMMYIQDIYNKAIDAELRKSDNPLFFRAELTHEQYESAWITSQIQIGKTILDLKEIREKIISNEMDKLLEQVNRQSISATHYIATGGGAIAAHDQLSQSKWFNGELEFVDDSEFACAKGNYIRGLQQLILLAYRITGKEFSVTDLHDVMYG